MMAFSTARLDRDATLLRSLHVSGQPLVLPNAWDVASARAVVAAGFPVVATSSAAIAASLGYPDHEGAPAEAMLGVARRIAECVDVPLTVDAEAGYGLAADDLVRALRDAGAAGINVEDTDHQIGGLRDGDRHAEWLGQVRAAAEAFSYPLVINARVDVFLDGIDSPPSDTQLQDALDRSAAYLRSGADCVFPILLRQLDVIAGFVAAVDAPVNILAIPPLTVRDLAAVGVARVSFGSLLHRRAMATFSEAVTTLAS